LKLAGAKKPDVEKIASIEEKYQQMGFSSNDFYIMKEDSMLNQFFRYPNEVRLFDKTGIMIAEDSLEGKKECSGNIVNFIKVVPPLTYAYRDSSQSIKACLESIRHINNRSSPAFDNSEYDYLVIVYWNLFSGKVRNEDYIKSIQNAITKNQNSKFQLIPVNCDMYEGVDWDQKYEDYKARIQGEKAQN
jgi:hypothetical protein